MSVFNHAWVGAGQMVDWIQNQLTSTFIYKAIYAVRLFLSVWIWAALWQNQQNDCAPGEDTDQPGHPPSLIRVFAVRSVGS